MATPDRSQQALEKQGESQSRSVSRRQETTDPFWGFGGDLFRTSPFALMSSMLDQMDRAFYGPGLGRGSSQGTQSWMPSVEVREKNGNLVVCADLPGIDQKDVKVEVNQDVLTIEGERRQEHEEGEGRSHRSERSYGHFYRAVQLPEGARSEEARAEFHNGVLEVKVPLNEQKTNRRQIPITAGSASSGKTVESGSQPQSQKK